MAWRPHCPLLSQSRTFRCWSTGFRWDRVRLFHGRFDRTSDHRGFAEMLLTSASPQVLATTEKPGSRSCSRLRNHLKIRAINAGNCALATHLGVCLGRGAFGEINKSILSLRRKSITIVFPKQVLALQALQVGNQTQSMTLAPDHFLLIAQSVFWKSKAMQFCGAEGGKVASCIAQLGQKRGFRTIRAPINPMKRQDSDFQSTLLVREPSILSGADHPRR